MKPLSFSTSLFFPFPLPLFLSFSAPHMERGGGGRFLPLFWTLIMGGRRRRRRRKGFCGRGKQSCHIYISQLLCFWDDIAVFFSFDFLCTYLRFLTNMFVTFWQHCRRRAKWPSEVIHSSGSTVQHWCCGQKTLGYDFFFYDWRRGKPSHYHVQTFPRCEMTVGSGLASSG